MMLNKGIYLYKYKSYLNYRHLKKFSYICTKDKELDHCIEYDKIKHIIKA